MPTFEQIQPYMPIIVMALNGLVAGTLASLLLGGGGLIRNLLVGISARSSVAPSCTWAG